MISPYVRRRRLAVELGQLREDHGYTTERLAKAVGVARQRISRLLNGHIAPDLDEIMRILAEFHVPQSRWTQIMTIAREAQERGWWEKWTDQMGPRQAQYANLEAGACAISEYQMTLVPGLLQIQAFTEARARVDHATRGGEFDRERAVEARAARQRMMDRPDGPAYEVIIDELAVRRPAAALHIVASQLDHLVEVGHTAERITIRVLPLGARIDDHAVPYSAFSAYRYPDPDDPVVVAVDTATSDLVLAYSPEVGYYLELYDRLRRAALAPTDSLDFLATVAEELRCAKD